MTAFFIFSYLFFFLQFLLALSLTHGSSLEYLTWLKSHTFHLQQTKCTVIYIIIHCSHHLSSHLLKAYS